MMISLDNYFGEYISVAASGYKEKQVCQVNRTFRLSQMGIEKKKRNLWVSFMETHRFSLI